METTNATSQLSPLKPGNYMKVTSVRIFLGSMPIHLMRANQLKTHKGECNVYFSTEDLKTIMSESVFREMECQCITHMIL